MAFLNEENKLKVSIPTTTDRSDHTVYDIEVSVGSVLWTVKHRYSEFQSLHQQLSANHGIAKHLLPPKKIIGNKEPAFIEKRRVELEAYLQGVVALMQKAIVDELAEFLQLADYEVLYLRQKLSMQHCNSQAIKEACYSCLEMHAISHGLDHARPSHTAVSVMQDFIHVAEAGTHIRNLSVTGSWNKWLASNIIPNELEYNFNIFKRVHVLTLNDCNVLKINDASSLRKSLNKLNASNCGLEQVSDILMCDSVHRDLEEVDPESIATLPRWGQLKDLNLSSNNIATIDLSISLCNKLETINLAGNKLSGLNYLTKLPYLISVVVSNNCIMELNDLHTKLGNLVHLDLSRNKLSSLQGLACLYSLVSLDVSCNAVVDVTEVSHVARLPCLEDFVLTGNPVATIVDYRTKVLEYFGNRCSEICLDNERPTQRELDKVAVLQALTAARESRAGSRALPTLNITCPAVGAPARHYQPSTLPEPDLATAVEEGATLD